MEYRAHPKGDQERHSRCWQYHLSANPEAITGPIGGGGGNSQAGTYVSEQQLGDLKIAYSAFPAGDSGDSCVTCDTPIVIDKFPWLKGMLGCWAIIASGNGGTRHPRVRS